MLSFLGSLGLMVFAGMQVAVMPMQAKEKDSSLAEQTSVLIREVLNRMPGVEAMDDRAPEPANQQEARKLFVRCGRDMDCLVKIGQTLGAQVVLTGSVSSLGEGISVDLQLMDVGSAKVMGKVSRSLLGPKSHQASVLEHLLTGVLFPEKMLGSLDLFIEPPGADIWIDGQLAVKSAGASVHLNQLSAQEHSLRIVRKGYAEFYALVQVPFKDTAKLNVTMRKNEGQRELP